MSTNEHALETLKWKKYKDMSNIEFCIIEYSKKYPTLAEKAAADNAAMQARIEKLEHLEFVARDVNKWLINTGRGGTGHQRSLDTALEDLKGE